MNSAVKVLIVDDSNHARRGLRALLATWPQIELVGEAPNGQEAINQVALKRPAVVVMDIQMPDVNGLDAARFIKYCWPEVRVVILSWHGDLRTKAMAVGVDAYLVKGCSGEEVIRAILNVDQLNDRSQSVVPGFSYSESRLVAQL
jgi:YesN/AraC family two-component response regulator